MRAPAKIAFALLALLLVPVPRLVRAEDQLTPPAKYKEAIAALDAWLGEEVALKKLPALSIALVDDQTTVWARGFGFADPRAKTPATADTLYRVGSVSKPFTTLLPMIFAELGMIVLDAQVQVVLPGLQPINNHGKTYPWW